MPEKPKRKRIQFTKRELLNLQGLICAAQAFGQSEGDYQGMTEKDWKAVDTASGKVAELLERKTRKVKENGRTS